MFSHERTALTNLEAIRKVYDEVAGTWTGCDWQTAFGDSELDLNGLTSVEATENAATFTPTRRADDWVAAAQWLTSVEQKADEAAIQGALALAAANAGCGCEALEHAQRAWALEREAGRPSPRSEAPSWQQLFQVIQQGQVPAGAPSPVQPEPPVSRVERQIAQLSEELHCLARRIDQLSSDHYRQRSMSHA